MAIDRGVAKAGVAGLVLVAVVVVATWISTDDAEPGPGRRVSLPEARALLNEAVALVRAGELDGLCRTDWSGGLCRQHLQAARNAKLVPDKTKPAVVDVVRHRSHEAILRLRGSYADGGRYETDFHVARHGDALYSATSIYWYPVTMRSPRTCTHEPGQVQCRMPATAPT